MPKDLESLSESRNLREHLITYWGRVPSSVWKVDWTVKSIDLSRSYNDQRKETGNGVFSLSGTGARHGALSRFPQDLCQFLIKFFTKELEQVIDPFAGHNSRFESCFRCNRHYTGFDISNNFMQLNNQVKEQLLEENKHSMFQREATITLHHTDSRRIPDFIQPETFDFCITSPPFYDIEDYGDEPGQLGKSQTYQQFIQTLGRVALHCYNALKPNKYIAWEVNDFRRNGVFCVYHYDTISIFRQAGFTIHDVIIVDYGNAFLKSFLTDVEHNKIMPKQHSYIIVGHKPNAPIKNEISAEQENNRAETRQRLLNELT